MAPCPNSQFFKNLVNAKSPQQRATAPNLAQPGPLTCQGPWAPSYRGSGDPAGPVLLCLQGHGPLLVQASHPNVCLSGDAASRGLLAPSITAGREAGGEWAQPAWCEC